MDGPDGGGDSGPRRPEFVKGWDVLRVLGEGAYGEVKLIVNRATQEAVAVKMIDVRRVRDGLESVKKEIGVHKLLNNEHIVKFYAHRVEGHFYYIFLEYASGGELFDQIEPDVGMPEEKAQDYFRQLITGVEYLHDKGVTHRDLKPENLLLGPNGNLLISDFGMATVFRHMGKERKLAKSCGTLPYIAPEVLLREYNAEPADIWSCGIILVAMLAGELPWDKATDSNREYLSWKSNCINLSPWTKIQNIPLTLLKNVLQPLPNNRYTLNRIKNSVWFKKSMKARVTNDTKSELSTTPIKRMCSDMDSPAAGDDRISRLSFSQPDPASKELLSLDFDEAIGPLAKMCFSQPARPEEMLLGSDISATPGNSQTPLQRLVKRMTRFFVTTNAEETLRELGAVFEKLGYTWKTTAFGQLTVVTLDKRKMQLTFKATLMEMDSKILVDFRLSKGDGLEFKRHFVDLKNQLSSIVCKTTNIPK